MNAAERRAHFNELRRLRAEQERVSKTPFLREWLTAFEQWKREFEAERHSAQALENIALEQGYRTWRACAQSLTHQEKALRLFVHDPAFQEVWNHLREQDRKLGCFAYSPSNGGLPATILRTIEDWHRAPKFTRSELSRHQNKIKRLAKEMLLLLGQLTPSAEYADRFSEVRVSDPKRIDGVVSLIDRLNDFSGARKTDLTQSLEDFRKSNLVRNLIAASGITTVSVIEGLRDVCSQEPRFNLLPRKIRAREAMKTYFIIKLGKGVSLSFMQLPNQLLANLVARLTETDCTADDVRKAIKASEASSLREHQKFLDAEDSASPTARNVPRKKTP